MMECIDPRWTNELFAALAKLIQDAGELPGQAWRFLGKTGERENLAAIGGCSYRIIGCDSLGAGFGTGLLGSRYAMECAGKEWPESLAILLGREKNRGLFSLVFFQPQRGNGPAVPLATFLEDSAGNFHLLEVSGVAAPPLWALLTLLFQKMAESRTEHTRYDEYGDFLTVGAHSIVQRHSTERLRKHISQKVLHEPRLCTQCLRCVTACSEMRAVSWKGEAFLLGPMEDYCTNCGLCRKRCSYLQVASKEGLRRSLDPDLRIDEGGAGVHLYGEHARDYMKLLNDWEIQTPSWLPFEVRTQLERPADCERSLGVEKQWILQWRGFEGTARCAPLLATQLDGNGEDSEKCVLRRRYRGALLLQTDDGEVEWAMARTALKLGMELEAVAVPGAGGVSFPTHETARCFYRMNRFRWASPVDLWKNREADVFLSPFPDGVSPELQQSILAETGRVAHIVFPHIFQAMPITRNRLLMELNGRLESIFLENPRLRAVEGQIARELLRDVPRNHALIHARYRHMAVASGHSACPTCAEVQVLALPVYMSIAMSLAREEIPRVFLTCETGCMSETLNKVKEVAQKVPGGRTVFGGGFAFGEAIAMVQDWGVRMGSLPKGRRYVVSQGGDGGSVIGLPAFLNALRQQAFLIRQRYPNALHFINVTDTQVYSNTGGESSASSLLGLGTLTTPVGKFLMGNQRIQWNLINLAAEFPGILVGTGHSGNKVSMQQFWLMADQLGQSAIRWDVTPCPETGKFFGEDPDDLAEIMAHAGMLPEVVFVGRFRKRVAPMHPEDRQRPRSEWRNRPKPVEYWLTRDPRYRGLFVKNSRTGEFEPRNIVAHAVIGQLRSYRDQLNWQIDLESRIVCQAEEWVRGFFQELRGMWEHYCYQLESFPYAMLFDSQGELKPEYRGSLEHEMVRRVLGWEPSRRYAAKRDGSMEDYGTRLSALMEELERLEAHWNERADASRETEPDTRGLPEAFSRAGQALQDGLASMQKILAKESMSDPLEEEIFSAAAEAEAAESLSEERRRALFRLLDTIVEERAIARQTELQQFRLAQQLKREFFEGGGIVQSMKVAEATVERSRLRGQIDRIGPFALGVASLAGDRGIAINRAFAQFFTSKGAWAGMAWQFGSSKRGTPVLSATFVDSKPLHRKDAMHSFPMAVLVVTNYEEMKQNPDLFFGQLRPGGRLIINHKKAPELLWRELVSKYPTRVQEAVAELQQRLSRLPSLASSGDDAGVEAFRDKGAVRLWEEEAADVLWGRSLDRLDEQERRDAGKVVAMASAKVISVDMDGIMEAVSGSSGVVSNLVAVGPIFRAFQELGFDFSWKEDLDLLSQAFPDAVKKRKELLNWYREAMERAVAESRALVPHFFPSGEESGFPAASPPSPRGGADGSSSVFPGSSEAFKWRQDPGEHLMIMGGTLAGMVLSQVATAESPLFYIGFPITPAGNPFYFMAEAFANGHPYIVVDEVNPSEKVAAEKLLGVGRTGGFLPVTFTASQGWRLFTEIIPQYVGARLEGIFILTKRALAAPNLNIEESHTDFMSFRDDGGIMLAPKDIQEYVPALYLARLLTHFARLPVILSIGGITDTHKIGLVRVPSDERVRDWLKRTLDGFDYLENKLMNRQGEWIVHGSSGTSAVYQETQSEIEKAHQAFTRVLPYALEAVRELTGIWLGELEVKTQGGTDMRETPMEVAGLQEQPPEDIETCAWPETLLILQGSLFPNAVEALEELEEEGWKGMGCLSIRTMNPFPEDKLIPWLRKAKRIVVLDRSNSFGSVPPLASRVLGAFAHMATRSPQGHMKPFRTMVGGLGGREVTVSQMKEILLSTHLLFHNPEEWESQLIEQWLEEDEILRALMAEAAALDLRNTNRHTRVPSHLRSREAEALEYETRLHQLKELLKAKDYARFLQNYHQVEMLGPREVLQESALLQHVVLHLEMRLARHAIRCERATLRHAMILLHFSHEPEDLEGSRVLVRSEAAAGRVPVEVLNGAMRLAGLQAVQGREAEAQRVEERDVSSEKRDLSLSLQREKGMDLHSRHSVVFDPEEERRIRYALREMVVLNGEKPLLYNPEDYEYALLEKMQKEPGSVLHDISTNLPPHEADAVLWSYRSCYRDVIDGTLQREILVRHHAPELAELFEGEGFKRLSELVQRLRGSVAAAGEGGREDDLAGEVERYLLERCLPAYPKNAAFYLDYFRSWVMPRLLEGRGGSPVS
ncbi:MAG: hypothetical protein GX443_04425 [Deltaproteobacteria bacterium]|nr:hypothetical protein [Deltaproteobacteria bacterium]